MEITGIITHVLEPITGTGANGDWKKQTFVLKTQGSYPKDIAFDVFNDKIPTPSIGDGVTVSINLDSREYNGKWYTNISAWECKTDGAQAPEQSPPADFIMPEEEGDALPF